MIAALQPDVTTTVLGIACCVFAALAILGGVFAVIAIRQKEECETTCPALIRAKAELESLADSNVNLRAASFDAINRAGELQVENQQLKHALREAQTEIDQLKEALRDAHLVRGKKGGKTE